MNKLVLPFLLTIAVAVPYAGAQHFDMNQWGTNRGYTDAPYSRYEADNGYCETNGTRLGQTDDQQYVQSEASNQQAVTISNGQWVSWTNDTGDANGVTLRYSVPYGQSAKVGVYVNNECLGTMDLNTNHSWQWNPTINGSRTNKPEYYSTHGSKKDWARMRFIDAMCLLSKDIPNGQKFEIRHMSGDEVTVDFVEIEKARKVECQGDWVRWDGSNLGEFISRNQGRTIYIEGYVNVAGGVLSVGNATLQGAGIFYTHLDFDGKAFDAFSGAVKDMRITTKGNQRYPNSGDGTGGSGYDRKCFNGASNGATVENVLVEYFECGGWMVGCNNMTLRHCRFRNNYADGINFDSGSSNNLVEQCNFRNNGDDDIASWSENGGANNNKIINVTCEHNWRASSIGFFGGHDHHVNNVLIKDDMENGIRLVSDFGRTDFSPTMYYDNIAIVHCGCTKGTPGRAGDFWGLDEGALHIEGSLKKEGGEWHSNHPDIEKAIFSNIDIIDSRGNAVFIGCSEVSIHDLELNNVNVKGVRDINSYAYYFENARGNGTFTNVYASDIEAQQLTNFVTAPDLASGTGSSNFNLTVNNSKPVPAGVKIGLFGLAWETAGRAADINEGARVHYHLRLKNIGETLPEDYNINASLRINGEETLNVAPLKGLSAGEERILTFEWIATAGKCEVVAELDPVNIIKDAVIPEIKTITKRINVQEVDWNDFTFDRVNGIDLACHDILWRTDETKEFGHGPINTGDRVQWAAVVYNRGYQDARHDTKIGVQYRVDGKDYAAGLVSWNDVIKEVNAGEIKLFPTNSGGSSGPGNNENYRFWTAESGKHSVTAIIDDSYLFQEADEGNNNYTRDITIPYRGVEYYADSETDKPDDLTIILTAISDVVTTTPAEEDNTWYGIDGRRYNDRPTAAGIYINNGRKVVIR